MSASAAKWLLASVIVARSSSFLFSKFILVSMNPFELLGLRFLLAFAFLLLVYRKRVMRTFSWDMVRKGAILGITLALGMAAEMLSLKETDVYLTAFLENMALAIVPLLTMAALRKLPSGKKHSECLHHFRRRRFPDTERRSAGHYAGRHLRSSGGAQLCILHFPDSKVCENARPSFRRHMADGFHGPFLRRLCRFGRYDYGAAGGEHDPVPSGARLPLLVLRLYVPAGRAEVHVG